MNTYDIQHVQQLKTDFMSTYWTITRPFNACRCTLYSSYNQLIILSSSTKCHHKLKLGTLPEA